MAALACAASCRGHDGGDIDAQHAVVQRNRRHNALRGWLIGWPHARGCAVALEQRAHAGDRPGEEAVLDIPYTEPTSGVRRWVDVAVVSPTSEDALRDRAAAARDGAAARREVHAKH